jgi:hypothetical protein
MGTGAFEEVAIQSQQCVVLYPGDLSVPLTETRYISPGPK